MPRTNFLSLSIVVLASACAHGRDIAQMSVRDVAPKFFTAADIRSQALNHFAEEHPEGTDVHIRCLSPETDDILVSVCVADMRIDGIENRFVSECSPWDCSARVAVILDESMPLVGGE